MQKVHLEKTESTNMVARRLWEEKSDTDSEPFVVIADEQESGVGRDGRRWHSPKGGLWFTVAWPITSSPQSFSSVPLVAGLAICLVLEEQFSQRPFIKWPNDILIGNRKLAGILCQTSTGQKNPAIFIGVGINGNYESDVLGGELLTPAITLLEALGTETDIPVLLDIMLDKMKKVLTVFSNEGFDRYDEELNKRLAWKGQEVSFKSGDGQQTGVIKSVNSTGGLIIESEGKTLEVISGEISKIKLINEDYS